MDPESSDETDNFLDPRERHFEAVFNDPHVLMALLDTGGTIRAVNRAAVELVRPDRSEIVGTPFWKGPWWAHSTQVQAELRRRVERAADGDYVDFETEYYTGDDEQRLTAGFLRPVRDDEGTVVSIVASGLDTTQFVQQQQQLEVLQRILRHNFRNGLNVIQGYAEEIVDNLSPSTDPTTVDELKAMAQLIVTEAEDLDTSISKIQRLEQPAAGRWDRLTVESLFTRVAGDFPNCEFDKTVPNPEIEVPAGLLTAVSEAVSNAITHHPEDEPTIELTATIADDTTPPQLYLHIADDGRGIPEYEVEPVLNGEETALTHTSGVGLWLIKWIVEQYGGEISIRADDSQGSQITIIYPVSLLSTNQQAPHRFDSSF